MTHTLVRRGELPPPPPQVHGRPIGDLTDAAIVIDATCALLSACTFAILVVQSDVSVRAPLTLLFVLFVPGWTLARLFGAPASVLSAIGSVALSIAVLISLGQSLVLFGGWKWYPAGLVLTGGCWLAGSWSALRHLARDVPRPVAPLAFSPAVPDWIISVSVNSVLIGNALVALGINRTVDGNFGVLGLVNVLSPLFWMGLILLVIGLVIVCAHGSRWAWLNVAALVTALHGLPGMLEPNPRFNVAWVHTGFADHIATEGTLLRFVDARFSWAGFFAGGGLLQRLTGTDSLLWLVRYAPLFYNGAAVILIGLLARRFRATEPQAVIAAALFGCLNWIGQDYFAPQATAFLLYLTIVTVVLYAFPAAPGRGRRRWLTTLLRAAPDNHRGLDGRAAVAVLAACCLLVVAMVISHQLTPGILVSATLLLVIVNATRLRVLPIFVAVVFLAWLSYAADVYWIGHFDNLTGSVGKVGSLVTQNVSARTTSIEPGRQIVLRARIGLALLTWGLASISIAVHWIRRRTPIALVCLFVAPFPMLVLQPYGGEMALRVCYFTLPPAAIMISLLVVPGARTQTRASTVRWVLCGAAIALLTPVFVAARFGNESFESFSNADVALSRRLYDVAPDGASVFIALAQSVQSYDRFGDVRFRYLPGGTADEITDQLTDRLQKSPVFVLLSQSQEAHGTYSLSRSKDWMQDLISELIATGRYRVIAELGRGVLLQLEQA